MTKKSFYYYLIPLPKEVFIPCSLSQNFRFFKNFTSQFWKALQYFIVTYLSYQSANIIPNSGQSCPRLPPWASKWLCSTRPRCPVITGQVLSRYCGSALLWYNGLCFPALGCVGMICVELCCFVLCWSPPCCVQLIYDVLWCYKLRNKLRNPSYYISFYQSRERQIRTTCSFLIMTLL